MKKCDGCRKTELVKVKIPADLSGTGKVKWKNAKIDVCLAPIIKALQAGGIDMKSCCCGHGDFGNIQLQDGRMMLILSQEETDRYITGTDMDSFSDVNIALHTLQRALHNQV